MKYLIIISLLFTAFSSSAQYCELKKEVFLPHGSTYFYNTHYSPNKEYILMNQSYLGALLFDSSLNLLQEHRTTCGACGGGNARISSDNQVFLSVVRDFSDTEDTVRLWNIATGDSSYMTVEQFAHYTPFNTQNKVLNTYRGKFQLYDMDKDNYEDLDINLKIGGDDFIDAYCFFSADDSKMLMHTDQNGLQVYDTKKWKLVKNIQKGMSNRDYVGLSDNKSTFFTVIENTIYLHSMLDFKLIDSYAVGTVDIWKAHFSDDHSYAIYRDKNMDVFFLDTKTKASTLLLKAEPYLQFDGICISPDNNHFIIGVNGNRALKFQLHRSGSAPSDVKRVTVFSYSEEEAAEIDNEIIQTELALRKQGFDLPIDGDINREDRKMIDEFCEKHELRSIWSDEAKAILGIPL